MMSLKKIRLFFTGRLFPCALALLVAAACIVSLSVYLPSALLPLTAAERLFSLAAGLRLLRTEERAESRASALLLLLLLPWTGAVVCFLRRPKKTDGYPPHPFSCADARFSAYARICESGCGLKPGFARSAEYFPDGKKAYPRLLNDLAAARRFVWMEYYIVEDGVFWRSVLSLLERKAREGLDVRLVYDDFGCALTMPRGFQKKLEKKGIKTHCFSRLRVTRPGEINHRNHAKCTVIDGFIAYTGGMNVADEYIGEKICYGHWKDDAVRLTGAPALEFARSFAERQGVPLPPCKTAEDGAIACVPFRDQPEGGNRRVCAALYRTLFASAQRTLFVHTPYLAPDEKIFSALADAAAAGADVRIMIPHVSDHAAVFALSRRYARKLARKGVKVREYEPGFLHAKSVVCDGKYAVVGSYNLDFRSLYLQYECGALVSDESFAASVERSFLDAWEQSVPVPEITFRERLLLLAAVPLAPLM
ncbi:MAG: phosphatidylserine/phosphatidylglycerophosphate/cardiolipin synthase family protein [Candidatus Gallimonas sp.]